jgi:ABC-type nitrate/sulfonate/bicarbonate transport system substrate-binding protein
MSIIPTNQLSTRRMFINRSGLALGGFVVLGSSGVLAACGDDDKESAGTTGSVAPGGTTAPAATTGPAATSAPAGSAAGELTEVRTQFSWIAASEWASWYMADSQGFFAANGIKGGLLHGGPNTPAVTQVVAGGGSEIGLAADELEVIRANAEGGDYVILAASYQQSPFGYCWLADTPISEAKDLVGKRIGGVQGDQIRIEAVFKINNLPVDYEFVPMSFDPQPLVDGEMDVITAYVTNQPISLKMQGVETKSKTFSDFGLTTYGDVIFAPRAWLEANRDVAVSYFKGLVAGAEANIASPDTVIPLLVEKYGADAELDATFEAEANHAYIALMTSDFTKTNGLLSMDPAYLASSVWPAYEAAGETSLPDIAKLVDTSILADAKP